MKFPWKKGPKTTHVEITSLVVVAPRGQTTVPPTETSTLVPLETGGYVKYEPATGSAFGVDRWQVFPFRGGTPQRVTQSDLAMAQASSAHQSTRAHGTNAPIRTAPAPRLVIGVAGQVHQVIRPLVEKLQQLEDEVHALRSNQPPAEAHAASFDLLRSVRALTKNESDNAVDLEDYDYDDLVE